MSQLVESQIKSWLSERCVEPCYQTFNLPSFWPRRANAKTGDGTDNEDENGEQQEEEEEEEEYNEEHSGSGEELGEKEVAGFEDSGGENGCETEQESEENDYDEETKKGYHNNLSGASTL